mmetsp:Transcript_20212/g.47154  ORF Transcript_20212/g.47154 Transcript_20212/m.47154 type:complete len:251 (+) Transcript_20212:1367-2119(+)
MSSGGVDWYQQSPRHCADFCSKHVVVDIAEVHSSGSIICIRNVTAALAIALIRARLIAWPCEGGIPSRSICVTALAVHPQNDRSWVASTASLAELSPQLLGEQIRVLVCEYGSRDALWPTFLDSASVGSLENKWQSSREDRYITHINLHPEVAIGTTPLPAPWLCIPVAHCRKSIRIGLSNGPRCLSLRVHIFVSQLHRLFWVHNQPNMILLGQGPELHCWPSECEAEPGMIRSRCWHLQSLRHSHQCAI